MTETWDGTGLPPMAAARVAEARRRGTWSSALSTGEFAAIRSVGFEPVGQVMGSAVYHVAYGGWYGDYFDCQYSTPGRYGSLGYFPSAVALSGTGAPSAALVQVLDAARRTAIGRMAAECAALGGDGVVAAQLTMLPFPSAPNCLEFKVIGTAVRAAGPVRPRQPFTSHLDGLGFAKLVAAGWVPVQLLVGMSVGVRHDDYRTLQQRRSWDNLEMDGWSQLVRRVRADARTQLSDQAAGYGGDGVILDGARLRNWEQRCPRVRGEEEQVDRIAESIMIGTAIARFAAAPSVPRTLSVLSLRGTTTATARPH